MTERSRYDRKNFNFISDRIEKAIIVNGQLDISPTPRPTRWDTPIPRPTHWDTPTHASPLRRTIRSSPLYRNIDVSSPRRNTQTSPPHNFSSFGKYSQNSIDGIENLKRSVVDWWRQKTT